MLLGQAFADRRLDLDLTRRDPGQPGADRRHQALAGEARPDSYLEVGIAWRLEWWAWPDDDSEDQAVGSAAGLPAAICRRSHSPKARAATAGTANMTASSAISQRMTAIVVPRLSWISPEPRIASTWRS